MLVYSYTVPPQSTEVSLFNHFTVKRCALQSWLSLNIVAPHLTPARLVAIVNARFLNTTPKGAHFSLALGLENTGPISYTSKASGNC